MATIELWLFTVTDPQTGKRRRTTYRLTMEEARARYVDPEPVPNSLGVRSQCDDGVSRSKTGAPCQPAIPAGKQTFVELR